MPCFWFFARQSCYRETSKRTKSQWHGTRQSYRKLKIFQTVGRKKRRCIVYAIRHSLRGDCGKSGPFSCKCLASKLTWQSRAKNVEGALTLDTIETISIASMFPFVYCTGTHAYFFPPFAKNFSKRNIAYSEACSIFIVLTRQEFQLKAEVETPLSITNYLSLATL